VSDVEVHFLDDAEAVADAAAAELVAAARAGAHVALSGGSTPERAYELAATRLADWAGATLWFGDDRCVEPEHEWSNYRMAREALLDRIPGAAPDVRRVRTELGAREAARLYDEALRGVTLDLALMGLGPDGHTASLFPNGPELDVRDRRAVPAEAGMEPLVERVTMTIPVFEQAETVLFLVAGEAKADAAARAFGGPPSREVPASLTRSAAGRTIALLDRAAASRLQS
jgi:6-phosphogluconolactonase